MYKNSMKELDMAAKQDKEVEKAYVFRRKELRETLFTHIRIMKTSLRLKSMKLHNIYIMKTGQFMHRTLQSMRNVLMAEKTWIE